MLFKFVASLGGSALGLIALFQVVYRRYQDQSRIGEKPLGGKL